MTLPLQTVVVAIAEQASVDLEDEAAILDLKTGVYFGLNEVGAHVWRQLQQPRTVGELRDSIVAEYQVEPERCERDLQALLQDLVAHHLIEVRRAAQDAAQNAASA